MKNMEFHRESQEAEEKSCEVLRLERMYCNKLMRQINTAKILKKFLNE